MLLTKTKISTLSMAEAAKELDTDTKIILIDVRTPQEFDGGHIPNSMNIPVEQTDKILLKMPKKDARLFVYCLSGGRSSRACNAFADLGYTNITNIGGISAWKGEIERN